MPWICWECRDESFIIPTSLFEIVKPLVFDEIPYCELSEIKWKHFLKKFHKFTNNSFGMVITWKTRNIRSLFPLKDKNDYKSCVIYKGDCSCGSRYIGETKRNAEVRWNEHNNPTKSSEPSKHLRNNINHYFTWAVLHFKCSKHFRCSDQKELRSIIYCSLETWS